MPGPWDATTDLRLLMNVIDQAGAKANWDNVAAAMGGGFTAEACRQHFAKLKKSTLDSSPNTNGATENGAAVTPSPRKRKPREPKAAGETPTKRPRKNAKKAAADDASVDAAKDAEGTA
ncbi:predicted protein [Uncinocarpus reesii 1704]|uniref:Myb-like domain-containing protein n=1 Tax=Uncinocarpus reesii (strain UAMH 1704) TaxID=336963 RepID=C4JMS0_UNCRE|nr:uncharacterized protein UREG_04128 [Uncinocarpus reesii 1704]EEP79282.1 predicted protein [Uncinocarpus reesii 1704]